MKKKMGMGGSSKSKMGMGGMHMMPDGSMMENSMMKKGGAVKSSKQQAAIAMSMKAAGKKPKMKDGGSTPFGMLSVKKGIDKNPKPTQADRIAGATMKKGGSVKKK